MDQQQVTKNCHYISRFLTKPWEFGERQLRYYDFDEDKFDTKSSRSLFAEDGLNAQQVESWLSDGPSSRSGAPVSRSPRSPRTGCACTRRQTCAATRTTRSVTACTSSRSSATRRCPP